MLDGVEGLGVIMLPFTAYLIYRKWFLNENELMMLLTSCVMLIGLVIGGWVCLLIYLICFGYHNLIVLQSARCTHLFNRQSSAGHSSWTFNLFTINENEIKLVVYMIYFWILIRILSLKSIVFDMGGGTFVTLMGGWNCTLSDFWVLNAVWLFLIMVAGLACCYLIVYDRESETLYKKYLLKYKILWDMVINIMVVYYHFRVYMETQSLRGCLEEYNSRSWMRCLWFWGFPASTLFFFWVKQGVFEQGVSMRTEGESELQKQLNEMAVNDQFQRVSSKKQQD